MFGMEKGQNMVKRDFDIGLMWGYPSIPRPSVSRSPFSYEGGL